MNEINTYSVTIKVEEENLAVSMGSGSLCVLATPCVVALMENAAAALADKVLDTYSSNLLSAFIWNFSDFTLTLV